jgi:hypothetical protein
MVRNSQSTMKQKTYPSSSTNIKHAARSHSPDIPTSIHGEDEDSNTESDSSCQEWSGPENQLGLEQDNHSSIQQNDQINPLDEKGETMHHKEIFTIYSYLT